MRRPFIGLVISVISVASVGLVYAQKPTGEVHLADGTSHPFIALDRGALYYKRVDDLANAEWAFGKTLKEASTPHEERLPHLNLKGLKSVKFQQYSQTEHDEIVGEGTVRCVWAGSSAGCEMRKASLVFQDGKQIKDIYLRLPSGPSRAIGPEKQMYYLTSFDVSEVVVK